MAEAFVAFIYANQADIVRKATLLGDFVTELLNSFELLDLL